MGICSGLRYIFAGWVRWEVCFCLACARIHVPIIAELKRSNTCNQPAPTRGDREGSIAHGVYRGPCCDKRRGHGAATGVPARGGSDLLLAVSALSFEGSTCCGSCN